MNAIAVMTKLNVKRGVHAAVVEPRQERDGEHHERRWAESVALTAIDDGADDEAVAGRQHAVLEDDEQRDVEGRERAEDVLGLGILPPCGGHRRAHLGVDHGHAGVEDAGEPAGHESAEHAALGRR